MYCRWVLLAVDELRRRWRTVREREWARLAISSTVNMIGSTARSLSLHVCMSRCNVSPGFVKNSNGWSSAHTERMLFIAVSIFDGVWREGGQGLILPAPETAFFGCIHAALTASSPPPCCCNWRAFFSMSLIIYWLEMSVEQWERREDDDAGEDDRSPANPVCRRLALCTASFNCYYFRYFLLFLCVVVHDDVLWAVRLGATTLDDDRECDFGFKGRKFLNDIYWRDLYFVVFCDGGRRISSTLIYY